MKDPHRENAFERFVRQVHGRVCHDGKSPGQICLEAGHIYVDEQPTDDCHYQAVTLAVELQGRLILDGLKPVPILFIDDYNPKKTTLCQRQYLSAIRSQGYDPVEVVMESQMVEGASKIIETLTEQGQVHERDGMLLTNKHRLCLRKKDGKLSCSALDAALYQYRFAKWPPLSITVLPGDSDRRYQDQQRNTRRLLRLLGWETLPMANVYFRQNGELTFSFPG